MGKTTAANLEQRFDAGENVSDYFDFSKARREPGEIWIRGTHILRDAMKRVESTFRNELTKALADAIKPSARPRLTPEEHAFIKRVSVRRARVLRKWLDAKIAGESLSATRARRE